VLVELGKLAAEQGQGAGDGFGASEAGLQAHDAAVEGFVELVDGQGAFEGGQRRFGVGVLQGDGVADERLQPVVA
jgi:hypothetical protein